MRPWDYTNEQWTKLPGHLKHLPLFTRHFDFFSYLIRAMWAVVLKLLFKVYIKLNVIGDFESLYKEHHRLLIISNHASHLDAVSIAAAIPFKYWRDLYISAAKDYWFRNPVFTFFSKHCLGAIPIDRKSRNGEAVKLCIGLLKQLDRIWMILFPEGTRSKDGYINSFKKGISVFSKSTETPILFLYIEGNSKLWPSNQLIPSPGKITIHVGPVMPPNSILEVNRQYKEWVTQINPNAYKDINEEEGANVSKN